MAESNKDPSARGEHVINNSVLKIYHEIVKEFVDDLSKKSDSLERMISSGRLPSSAKVLHNINQPLEPRIADLVQKQLVVHLSKPYHDQNAGPYGDDVKLLRTAIIQYMMLYYAKIENPSDSTTTAALGLAEKTAKEQVRRMISRGNFIDEHILTIWKKEHPKDVAKFNEAKAAVVSMIKKLTDPPTMVHDWVIELNKAYKAGLKK